MTVSELITQLQRHDPNAIVLIPDADYHRTWEQLKVVTTDPQIPGHGPGVYLDSFE